MNTTPARSLIAPKLRTLPIFSDLDDAAIETLASMVTYKQVPKGSFIVTQHERRVDVPARLRARESLFGFPGRQGTRAQLP
jgi:hypothetical protein